MHSGLTNVPLLSCDWGKRRRLFIFRLCRLAPHFPSSSPAPLFLNAPRTAEQRPIITRCVALMKVRANMRAAPCARPAACCVCRYCYYCRLVRVVYCLMYYLMIAMIAMIAMVVR